MSADTTPLDLDAIAARAKRAYEFLRDAPPRSDDRLLAQLTHTDVPALLAEVERLRVIAAVADDLDVFLAEQMRDPQFAAEFAAIRDGRVAAGELANGQLRAELAELRALFELQWTRMGEATERWRAEDPDARALVMPDLGGLLTWLMADADTARAELADGPAAIMPRADRDRFTVYASVQAIAARRRLARNQVRRWEQHVRWLEGLAAERARQVEAGEWPQSVAAPSVAGGAPC